MEYGPIQLIVLGFRDNDHFSGEIARELGTLRSRGMIRLVDSLTVTKDEHGEVNTQKERDISDEESIAIGSAIRAMFETDGKSSADQDGADEFVASGIGFTPEDIKRASEELAPGTSALYLLFEHTWATGIKHAVRNAGGFPIVQGFLTPEVAMMIGSEVEAIVEAERAIDLAEAVKGAAILDAIITAEDAAETASSAVQEAEKVVASAKVVREAAAAEAIRALIVADIIEASAADLAAQALVAAEMIDPATFEAAARSAATTVEEVKAFTAGS